ncbi:MAG: hypothetical protein M1821_002833 [Bathelium mastoideum]|nr:MAG: hypothetical protein M1821_002833 [Bathelium mastoideum]
MFGKKYYGLTGTSLNVAVGLIAGLDFLLFGYDQGVMGALLTLPSFTKLFPKIDVMDAPPDRKTHVAVIQGLVVGAYTLGCFFGALLTIWLGDKLGRRRMIFVGSSIMTIGAILQCTSYGLAQLIVGRLITGFGNGMNTSTVPTWQSETSKAHRRGQLVMIEGAMITGGICISYWIDFGLSYAEPSSVAWRFPVAFQIFFALIILATVLGLPESPRWLILKGREDEAMEVLAALSNLSTDHDFVHNEFSAIKDTVLEAEQYGFRDLLTMDENRNFHRVVLAYVNQVFQQISGINLITYYAETVFETYIHLSPFISRILAACNGTEYFLASWIPVVLIERAGRRTLMLIGAAGMSGSMAVLAGSTSVQSPGPGIVAATFLFVFNTFFAIGWLGMTWLYPAEIVPLRIRAPSNALSTSANWIFNWLIVVITPIAFANIGYRTYIIFCVINAFIFPVVYFFYPETAYRSLEEMDSIFMKTHSVFSVVKVAREEPKRYGKNGELLLSYDESEAHRIAERKSSVAGQGRKGVAAGAKAFYGDSAERKDESPDDHKEKV